MPQLIEGRILLNSYERLIFWITPVILLQSSFLWLLNTVLFWDFFLTRRKHPYRMVVVDSWMTSKNSSLLLRSIHWLLFAIMQVFAELKDLPEKIASNGLESPTLLIIGKVVELSPFWPMPTKQESSLMQAWWVFIETLLLWSVKLVKMKD